MDGVVAVVAAHQRRRGSPPPSRPCRRSRERGRRGRRRVDRRDGPVALVAGATVLRASRRRGKGRAIEEALARLPRRTSGCSRTRTSRRPPGSSHRSWTRSGTATPTSRSPVFPTLAGGGFGIVKRLAGRAIRLTCGFEGTRAARGSGPSPPRRSRPSARSRRGSGSRWGSRSTRSAPASASSRSRSTGSPIVRPGAVREASRTAPSRVDIAAAVLRGSPRVAGGVVRDERRPLVRRGCRARDGGLVPGPRSRSPLVEGEPPGSRSRRRWAGRSRSARAARRSSPMDAVGLRDSQVGEVLAAAIVFAAGVVDDGLGGRSGASAVTGAPSSPAGPRPGASSWRPPCSPRRSPSPGPRESTCGPTSWRWSRSPGARTSGTGSTSRRVGRRRDSSWSRSSSSSSTSGLPARLRRRGERRAGARSPRARHARRLRREPPRVPRRRGDVRGSRVWLIAAVLVVVGLNVLAETVTFTRTIDAIPPLRWFDRLGRLPEPTS